MYIIVKSWGTLKCIFKTCCVLMSDEISLVVMFTDLLSLAVHVMFTDLIHVLVDKGTEGRGGGYSPVIFIAR